jgi:signal transduction histidine kinase
MGRYREAADAYLTMYLLKDSLDNRQMRDQTNEMATLYRVDELAREQEMTNQRIAATKRYERMRLFTVALCLGGFFLLVFLVYWYVNSRRLRRKNEELTVAHRQAQESSLMKTKFIQNMSHEIRTPLNIVSGFSQILTQSGDDLPAEQKKEVCEKIEENTNRITTLITQLLDLSESDSIAVIERNDDVACNDICRQAIIRSKVGDNLKRHFTFDTTLSDDERIITSASYAVEALSRLLNNAQKFSTDGSTIRLTCDKDQDAMVVAVENDTTQPIPSDQAEHIFEPFVQLNDFLEGVGIGLTVSRNVVRRLGGDIRLDTTAAPTVRFIFTLPLHTAT